MRLIENGLRVEGHGRYCSMTDDGREMEIATERIEDIDMTVAEFCKLLIGVVEAGGMESFWPGKIRICLHIRGWADIPIE